MGAKIAYRRDVAPPQTAPRCGAGRGLASPALDALAAGRHRTVFVSTCPHGRSAKKPADSRLSEIRPLSAWKMQSQGMVI